MSDTPKPTKLENDTVELRNACDQELQLPSSAKPSAPDTTSPSQPIRQTTKGPLARLRMPFLLFLVSTFIVFGALKTTLPHNDGILLDDTFAFVALFAIPAIMRWLDGKAAAEWKELRGVGVALMAGVYLASFTLFVVIRTLLPSTGGKVEFYTLTIIELLLYIGILFRVAFAAQKSGK